MAHSIGVIGQGDEMLLFKGLGAQVFPAHDAAEATRILRELVAQGFSVVLLGEQLGAGMQPVLDELATRPLPSVVLIPGVHESGGVTGRRIDAIVERAIGATVTF